MRITSYKRAVEYLESLIPNKNTGKRLYKLERVAHLLELMGNPHESFKSIHIGGTAGKGSITYITAGILKKAGYKAGLHISPHINRVNERIQVNGKEISDKDLTELVEWAKPKIEKTGRETDGLPTYFEAVVAIAFEHFRRKKVDVAAIEVGLGGKLDATNVITPLVSVITNIHFDHRNILGWTVGAIARNKAGIIKEGVPVVTGATQKDALEVIKKKAKKEKAPLTIMGRDVQTKLKKLGPEGLLLNVKTKKETYLNLKTPLLGEYQAVNIATAITALEKSKLKVSKETIRKALREVRIPGRIEAFNIKTLHGNKTIILDGAHNPKKMESFVQTIKKLFPKKKFTFIFAIKKGKNQTGTMRKIAPITRKIYFSQFLSTTDFGKKKSKSARSLSLKMKKVSKVERRIVRSPEEALDLAIKEFKGDDIIIVTGSFYLVGEVRARIFESLLKKKVK
ncbi:hypothetical protein CL629_03600 [bacterium]|nr:hypothetical protein [bacterium]|tara:strand:- start:341 stop:1702 length:1362 start_codon:yes stop_codon:yes gene_type:complete